MDDRERFMAAWTAQCRVIGLLAENVATIAEKLCDVSDAGLAREFQAIAEEVRALPRQLEAALEILGLGHP
jgi:hypothetical protein